MTKSTRSSVSAAALGLPSHTAMQGLMHSACGLTMPLRWLPEAPATAASATKARQLGNAMRKPLKGQCQASGVMLTDKLESCGAPKGDIVPGVEHRPHKRLNNRVDIYISSTSPAFRHHP